MSRAMFNPPPRRQQGMVLVVCLLVIVVITLIAATATKTSTFEEKMAASTQSYNQTFQAAESAVEIGIGTDSLMFEALDNSSRLSSKKTIDANSDGVIACAITEFKAEGIAPGNSIGSASTFIFEVEAGGKMEAMNASTVIRQGFYRVSFVGTSE